ERRGQVVDLGEGQVLGAEAGLLVGGVRDRVPERALGGGDGGRRVGGEVGQVDDRVGEGGGHGRDGPEAHAPQAPPAGELGRGEHDRRAAVGGGADVEQVQRVGHDRRGQHLLDGDLLAVAGVGVGQAVAG